MACSHPFGQENEVSVKQLVKCFCNNVYLGQWELARACIAELHSQQHVCPISIKDLLKAIAERPHEYCTSSATVQGPYSLSWLAYLEYEKYEHDQSKCKILQEETEFKLLLVESYTDDYNDVFQELLNHHKVAVKCRVNNTSVDGNHLTLLSRKAQSCIRTTLESNPLPGHSLLKAFKVDHPEFTARNKQLCSLHLESLKSLLSSLHANPSNSDTFYDLLSLFDPSEEQCEELGVSFLLRSLSEHVDRSGSEALAQAYSALVGQESTQLLQQFSALHCESQLSQCCRHSSDVADTGLTGLQQSLVALLAHPQRPSSYLDLFWLMLQHDKHFLQSVVETSLELVKENEFEKLSKLLGVAPWKPLRPLVLLLSWDQCSHPDMARSLLTVLHDDESEEGLLSEASRRLAYQLNLLQWCLDRARSIGHGNEESAGTATGLFHSLETRSVLQTLQQCGLLNALDQTEVFDMLTKMPTSLMKDTLKPFKKEKTVRFADENSESLSDDKIKYNIAQEKDTAIYRSFCALKCFTEALNFCRDPIQWQIFKTPKIRRPVLPRSSSSNCFFDSLTEIMENRDMVSLESDFLELKTSLQELQKLYEKRVTKLLAEGREHLSKLLPLNYRCEQLENVFALLFTMNEDVQECLSDSEGLLSSRNTSRQTSRENLSSLGSVSSEQPGSPFLSGTEDFRSQPVSPDTSGSIPVFIEPEEPASLPAVFSITTTELKEDEGQNFDGKLSGNASCNSVSSISASHKGFIANEFFIRDLLAVLKECMLDINRVRFALQGQSVDKSECGINVELHHALSVALECSVDARDLQTHISKLHQCISEAHWRFQLIAHDWLPVEAGNVVIDLHKLKGQQHIDDDFDLVTRDSSRRRKKRKRTDSKQSCEGSLSTGESESLAATTDESTNEPCSPRLRQQHSLSSRDVPLQQLASICDDIICDMLITPTDLVNSCLKRDKFAQAEQVIKMFCMEEDPVSVEVNFAVHFSHAVKKLQSSDGKIKFTRSISAPMTLGPPRMKLGLLKPSLSTIANVAAAGIANVSTSSIVDQVLSLSALPGVAPAVLKEISESASPLKTHVTNACIPAMVVLDLACSTCRTWESSLSMLDMALLRCSYDSPITFKSGFTCFLDNLVQLIKAGSSIQPSDDRHKYLRRSISQILTRGSLSLQVADVGLYTEVMGKLEEGLRRVERAYKEQHVFTLDMYEKPGKTVTVKTKPAVRQAMKTLVLSAASLIPHSGLASYLLRGSNNSDTDIWKYISELYSYVKFISTMVLDLEGKPTGTQDILGVEYFKVLEQSPTEVLGKLIFSMNIPPAEIDSKVKSFGINLTQIILNACCPNVPLKPRRPYLVPPEARPYKEVFGKKVLNHQSTKTPAIEHPEVLVREILTKLVSIMKERSSADNPQGLFTLEVARSLSDDPQLCEILDSTSDLKAIDLSVLSDKEHKLSFYGNLVNLLSMHACLATLQENAKSRISQSSTKFGQSTGVSAQSLHSLSLDFEADLTLAFPHTDLEHVLYEDRWSYEVGQLGIVSLFELKYIVVRAGLPLPSRYNGLVSARCPVICSQDPWRVYGPPMEPRMTFLICEGYISSPPLQVLSPEMVTSQLRMALKQYLHSCVSADTQTFMVLLPQLLVWYSADFVSDVRQDAREYESLLEFVSSQVEGNMATDVKLLLNTYSTTPPKGQKSKTGGVQVFVSPFCGDFGVTFDFDQYTMCKQRHIQGHKRHSSLQLHIHSLSLSSNSDDELDNTSLTLRPNRAMFHITAATSDYLATAGGDLVATLAALASSDGTEVTLETPLGQHYADGTEPEPPLVIATSDPSSLKEIRRSKIKVFPNLQRHILHQVLPLEIARDGSLQDDEENALDTLTRNSMHASSREALLLSPASKSYSNKVWSLLVRLVSEKQWTQAAKFLHNLPQITTNCEARFTHLHDFIMCCAGCNTELDDSQRTLYSMQINDPYTRVHCLLGLLPRLPVDICVNLLKSCDVNAISKSQLHKALSKKLQTLKVYQKITSMVQAHQSKVSRQCSPEYPGTSWTPDILQKLSTWQGIISHTGDDPDSILDLILMFHDFQTARDWANIHQVRQEIFQVIEEKYVAYLLEKDQPDYLKAYQVLEQVKAGSSETCLKVCEDLLMCLGNKQNVLFVAQFMLTQLNEDSQRGLVPSRQAQLHLLMLGCKMLLHLPESMRTIYDHLISSPSLLLEQLLMNMKIDHIGKILKDLHTEIKCSQDEEFCIASCDTLLVKYASKALEFPVCKTYESSFDSGSGSGSATLSRSQSKVSLSSVGHLSPLAQPPTPTKTMQILGKKPLADSSDDLTQTTSTLSPTRRFPRSESTPVLAMHRTGHSGSAVGSLPVHSPPAALTTGGLTPGRKLLTPTGRGGYSISPNLLHPGLSVARSSKFTMPADPPTKDQWIPDDAVTQCMVCEAERFSMFNRRHHCRRCGRVVCSSCSTHTISVRGVSARTCDDCYNCIYKSREEIGVRSGGSSVSEGRLEQIAEAGDGVVGLCAEYQYMLVLDDEQNEATREEFYYDQAPSTSLCLAVLELLSDQRHSAHVILNLVDDSSKLLQPLARGVKNPEVDYHFIISILKYLLFHAKVKLQKVGDNSGVGLCDQYLARLDLLTLLVKDNCPYIPSMQQLTKVEILRSLRDKLIEEERLGLAMEVSTKCGIDPTGVWAAWGMSCLHAGDLTAARDKFSKCLKTPKDKNQAIQGKLLSDIIEFLETHGSGGAMECVVSPLSALSDLVAESSQVYHEDGHTDEMVLQECLHYLKSYGNHLSIVAFYMKHQRLPTALHYCREMKVNSEVFVDGVLMAALQAGQLNKVLDIMVHSDPSLEQWAAFLNATCRHLNKAKLINTLYTVQVFMKDFIRAAMTCITYFYQAGATSYADLATRLQHLTTAKQHLEKYLDDRHWGAMLRTSGAGARSQQPDTLRMIMTPAEVNKYVNTISLQTEVTKFLHRYLDNLESVMSKLAPSAAAAAAAAAAQLTQSSGLPTLFGSTKTKTEVVQLILLSGNNINDGFGLAFRIIQDFKLDAVSIYTKAARYLAHLHQYQSIKQLLSCVEDSGLCTDLTYDEVVLGAIDMISQQPSEAKETEALIKILRSDIKRIQAYIGCGKLKSAYLVAVKRSDEAAIQLIAHHAEKLGQMPVKSICDKWLQQRQADS